MPNSHCDLHDLREPCYACLLDVNAALRAKITTLEEENESLRARVERSRFRRKSQEKYTRETLTVEAIKTIIHYDSETGLFVWAAGRGKSKAGGRPGGHDKDGYIRIGIGGVYYGAHRLAWFIHYGKWPDGMIDHINRDKSDNRIANLRDVTPSVNGRNIKDACCKSISGLRGVVYKPESGKYAAKIKTNGKDVWLGTYATKEEAHSAYMKAKEVYHPEFYDAALAGCGEVGRGS